jgi:two-component system response regulator YesN
MRKLLIIEDDKKIRVLLKRLLEKKFRMEVCEAEDGMHGLEVYRTENPRMIFLDLLMPNMNGIDFLAKLREIDKQIPVVVMTGLCDKEYVQKMVELGITDYVIKSDFIFQLEARIADILYSHDEVFK